MAIGCLVLTPTPAVAVAASKTSALTDPAGDATFPNSKYHASPPGYLDIVNASIRLRGTTWEFRVTVNATIPSAPVTGYPYSHLGPIFGLETNSSTAVKFGLQQFKEQPSFNWLVGLVYANNTDGAPIIGLGWHGWLLVATNFSTSSIPFTISGATFTCSVNASLLGSFASMSWLVVTELDWEGQPEPSGAVEFADAAPDHGLAAWP